MAEITPSQTVGPYFAYGPDAEGNTTGKIRSRTDLVTPDASGERIRIEGRVFDGDGLPIDDCMIEIWQADAQGRYAHPADRARGRIRRSTASAAPAPTPRDASLSTRSSRGRCPVPTERRRRRTSCSPCSRAACCGSYTRIYFDDEAANADDRSSRWCRPTGARRSSPPRRWRRDARSIPSTSACRAKRKRSSSRFDGG